MTRQSDPVDTDPSAGASPELIVETRKKPPRDHPARSKPSRSGPRRSPVHPIVWLILYVPFGGVTSFVTIGLGFRATQHGLSVTDGALLVAAGMLISWLKWLWAPVVDITLSPKRWYLVSAVAVAIGVLAMSVVPLNRHWLPVLLVVIAASYFTTSIQGMAVEAMVSTVTPPEEIGRVSAWFQSGNLGGGALGGGLGLVLFEHFSAPWISGVGVAALFLACALPLLKVPHVEPHSHGVRPAAAVRGVASGLWSMLKTRLGFLSALLCVMPIGTGAAQAVLTQSTIAAHWGANADTVAMVQSILFGLVTTAGCFAGGWVCKRLNARGAYAVFGLVLAGIAAGMAMAPANVTTYIGGNMVYAFGVGLAYAGFTAVALTAVGNSPAATGYNVFASLSNFPIWWVGLVLGSVADHYGGPNMLLTEAGLGVLGVVFFSLVSRIAGQRLFGPPLQDFEAAS